MDVPERRDLMESVLVREQVELSSIRIEFFFELIFRNKTACLSYDCAQCANIKFVMQWNGQGLSFSRRDPP